MLLMHGFGIIPASPVVKLCLVIMTFVCGLIGLFEMLKTQIYLIVSPWDYAAGARAESVSPAFSAIRS